MTEVVSQTQVHSQPHAGAMALASDTLNVDKANIPRCVQVSSTVIFFP